MQDLRKAYLVGGIFTLTSVIFIIRLFYLQVIDTSYEQTAIKNSLRKVVNYPARGLMYDRNEKLLVYNKAAYDLLVTPREVHEFDTTQLCNLLQIEKKNLIVELEKAKKYSRFKPSVIIKQLSPEIYARLQEKLYKYQGFYVQARTLREYTKPIAAHMLGYVGEVNKRNIENDNYYSQGDYIGITGLERAYEKELRGTKGANFLLVDVHNRQKGAYNNGQNDTTAILGNNLVTTIDIDLQEYCEKLMQNKRGSVVAIEPSTGEILCFYSGPSFDPGLLVGRERSKNYNILLQDEYKPLTNRAISAAYSPGSTFKMLNGLIAMQESVITEQTAFQCSGPGSTPIRCTHYHGSPVKIKEAVKESCNPFFWNAFRASMNKLDNTDDSYNLWRNYAMQFGLGKKLGNEFFGQSTGNIPSVESYNKIYGKGGWNSMTIRSLAIGQGEIILTPLQMANYASVLANRGYYIDPHFVKRITNQEGKDSETTFKRFDCDINKEHFEPIIEGMQMVVERAAGRYRIPIDSIAVCGKTGTIQNSSGGSDHSAFIAFAPRENPKIAIAVFIENGVWGSRYAAPIATLIMEKYLNGEIKNAQRKSAEEALSNINLLGINND